MSQSSSFSPVRTFYSLPGDFSSLAIIHGGRKDIVGGTWISDAMLMSLFVWHSC